MDSTGRPGSPRPFPTEVTSVEACQHLNRMGAPLSKPRGAHDLLKCPATWLAPGSHPFSVRLLGHGGGQVDVISSREPHFNCRLCDVAVEGEVQSFECVAYSYLRANYSSNLGFQGRELRTIMVEACPSP